MMFRPVIGFSGSEIDMSKYQYNMLELSLILLNPIEVHHGDCIGSDAQFHDICEKLRFRIIIHPAVIISSKRAFKSGYETLQPKPPLKRNEDMAKISQIILATPQERVEILRSGTWSTIRYARKLNKKCYIFHRNGDYEVLK